MVLSGVVLWQVDRTGAEEIVQAEVLETRIWQHRETGGGSHTHVRATLEIEGLVRATLDRAAGLQPGQTVSVRIRRGRLTGRLYFLDRATTRPADTADPPPVEPM